MKNFKMRKKLTLSFSIVLALFIISIVSGLFSLSKIKTELTAFYEHPYRVSQAANAASVNMEALQKNVLRAISTKDANTREEALAAVDSNYTELKEQLPVIEKYFLGDKKLAEQALATLDSMTPYREHAIALIQDGRQAEAGVYLEENYFPVIINVTDYLNKIIDTTTTNASNLINSTNKAHMTTTILLVVMCLVSLFISILLCLYITRAITGPVQEIKDAADNIADGNLDTALNYESQDELGSLVLAMKTMILNLNEIIDDIGYILNELSHGNFHVRSRCLQRYTGNYAPILGSMRLIRDNLNSTLTQISESADQVASGSEQVSCGAQTLSQGASEQAGSIEELAENITDISIKIENSTRNAQSANRKAAEVALEVSTGSERMQNMLTAMSDIESKSNEIGSIIKTIEDIAFQTNILALNAAVEAARAGDAGKGFAVVAREVRSLATKSAAASKDTALLVKESLQSVKNGTHIAGETAKSLFTIVDGVNQVTETINHISIDSNEQSDSIAQINSGIKQISNIIQTNSAIAQESAAASEELSAQAQMLNSLVGQFDLL